MTVLERAIGDLLAQAISAGEIRTSDVPQIVANAALRALDNAGVAYGIGGCLGMCCATITINPTCTLPRTR